MNTVKITAAGYVYGMLAANLTGAGADVHFAVTLGSATVTGTGTDFKANNVGDWVQIGGDTAWYQVKSVTSTTVLILDRLFAGPTNADTNFRWCPKIVKVKKMALRALNAAATLILTDGGSGGTEKWGISDVASGAGATYRYVEADFGPDGILFNTDCYATISGTDAIGYVAYDFITPVRP